jgi:hypothetical protein
MKNDLNRKKKRYYNVGTIEAYFKVKENNISICFTKKKKDFGEKLSNFALI